MNRSWLNPKPLRGKIVLVTRPKKQIGKLKEALKRLGARVTELPTIEIRPPSGFRFLDQAIGSLSGFDRVVFTSANGVDGFFRRLRKLKKNRRVLSGVRIASIGPATSERLRSFGISPDLEPAVYTTESLAARLKKLRLRGKKILLLRADIAPEGLRASLEQAGALVTETAVYETKTPPHLKRDLKKLMNAKNLPDYVTFTSASTAASFYESLPREKVFKAKAISIGPVTSKAVRAHGGQVAREARQATAEGIVTAILEEERRGISKHKT